MSEITVTGNGFVGYEYKDVTVKRHMEALYVDNYPNFGWKLDGTAPSINGITSVQLKFKRDRRIRNKAELSRLERQFDNCMIELERLERSKTISPSAWAYGVGLIGTAFMAGSVFAVTSNMIALCVILGIPGFVGWGLAYLLYQLMSAKKAGEVSPLIDQQYNMIYDVCEQANALLA